MRKRYLLVLAICGLILPIQQVHAQTEDPAASLYNLINQARLDAGLPPYAASDLLQYSAQRHAEDMATHTLTSSTGSDGSTAVERIADSGYTAWGNGVLAAESVGTSSGTVEAFLSELLTRPSDQELILATNYREIGIGIATTAEGQSYYVLDLGARPNVLPIFINDGAETTESPQIALRLSNENAHPQGEGMLYLGQALEVRINDRSDFEGLAWQQWESLLAWTLPEVSGEYTLYVQFRDGAGRTAISADSIQLLMDDASPIPPDTPSPSPTETPPSAPSGEEPPAVLSVPTPTPTIPPTSVFPPAINTSLPSFPTWTPLPLPTDDAPSGPGPLLGFLCGLQAVTALVGILVALLRRPPGETPAAGS